jgi:NADPH-dependent 2,4-dienoyl-CoA reductase/sulfur reductase-like enzyme
MRLWGEGQGEGADVRGENLNELATQDIRKELFMSKERLIVIGGNAAGMSAASQARRQRPDLEVLAFEEGPHTSYSA